MKITASALLGAGLLVSAPLIAVAQTEAVIVEAESGVLGSGVTTVTADGVTYVTALADATTPPNGATDPRVSSYQITFPAAGDYELYARFYVGENGANDDSWYFGFGFGNSTNWPFWNSPAGGYTEPTDTVLLEGPAGTQVFKWVRITPLPGRSGGLGPTAWTVPAGELTQTFYWATRENGMLMDKFAFGRAGSCYTVADLDTGTAATGTCPPPPPPPPPPYTRVGDPLAEGHDKFLGSAWSPGEASRNFGAYFNKVTPENAGKWGSAEPQRDVYNWGPLDESYRLAKDNGWPFHFHVLIWGNQQPVWLDDITSLEEQLAEIEEWFRDVSLRYPDIDILEVVNEPLHDPPCERTDGGGGYCEALGGTGPIGSPEEWTWVLNAFRLAKKYFTNPNTVFMLNDYSIANEGNQTTRYLALIDLLKAEDLIDIVGIQGHAFSTTEPAPMTNFRANLDRLAAGSGLPIHATEMDVDGVEDEVQLRDFQKIFPVFWEHPAIEGVTLWGYRQNFHWRNNQGAWLIWGGESEGAERPAMQWLVSYLENNLPEIAPDQELSVEENSAGGTAVGTVEVTDADTDQTLSAWQIDGGSGVSLFQIDADTGAITVVDGAELDFETTTSYTLDVSVFDGFRRSESVTVTINVENLNDNTPEIAGGQSFAIDGGSRNFLGVVEATDADDTNEPGFTDFQGWKIVGGTGASLFAIGADNGLLRASRPLLIDWRKSSYTLVLRMSDGENVSATESVAIAIPNRVKTCLYGLDLTVPKKTTPVFLLLGATLGSCRAP